MNFRIIFPLALFLLMNWPGKSGDPKSVAPVNSAVSGKASYYHNSLTGLETSSGELYQQEDFTAAHRTMPFNTIVMVTNKKDGRHAIVRINDRGPFIRSRIIDLSRAAAQKIGMVPFGVIPVKLKVLNYLDGHVWNDSVFKDENYWDCYGKPRSLHGITVLVWKTDDWKHAIYMASSMALDYKMDSVLISMSGKQGQGKYRIFITAIPDKPMAGVLISRLRKDGFFHAGFFNLKN